MENCGIAVLVLQTVEKDAAIVSECQLLPIVLSWPTGGRQQLLCPTGASCSYCFALLGLAAHAVVRWDKLLMLLCPTGSSCSCCCALLGLAAHAVVPCWDQLLKLVCPTGASCSCFCALLGLAARAVVPCWDQLLKLLCPTGASCL